MSFLVLGSGWLVAACLLLMLRRRLELVARAEHELRGPAGVVGLAVERMRRDPSVRRHVAPLDVELARLRAGLEDLRCARRGRRAAPRREAVELEPLARGAAGAWAAVLRARGRTVRVDWRAGRATVDADRGRVAQAFANLMANAAEHGSGPVEVLGRRVGGGVRVEVRNGRGRGLAIASSAAESAGGRLDFAERGCDAVAAIELPEAERE